MKPTVATAITAATVAIVPRRVPCSQLTADTSTPDPCGSAKESCASAPVELNSQAAAARIRARNALKYIAFPWSRAIGRLERVHRLKCVCRLDYLGKSARNHFNVRP